MADISIMDQVHLTGSIQLADNSPLVLANLKTLNFSSLPIVSEFDKSIDLFSLDEVNVGVEFGPLSNPALLLENAATLGITIGTEAALSVYTPKRKTLFDDDQFAPAIQINAGECWAALCLSATLQELLGVDSGCFGVTITHATSVGFGTFVRFPKPPEPMPTLKAGLGTLFENFSVAATPEKMRAVPVGIAHTTELEGSIGLGACYTAPLLLNPLATLNLPLNLALGVTPGAKASVSGSIALEGSFVIRAYRSAANKLTLGVYKKKKTTLTAKLSGSASVGVDSGKTDVLAAVLDALVPAADLNGLQLEDGQKEELAKALKECVDQSISIAVNASCSASVADEAAVVYELDLSVADMTQTDSALAAALRGDWSKLETLPNAHRVRNIVRELHDRNHKLNLNLLGLYNATSVSDYLKSSTVIHDEHGQIAMVDEASAKSLSAGTTPYAAKSDKLRLALAQAFVATVAYGASLGKIGVTSFTVRQSLLDYKAQANASDLTREISLARAVGLALNEEWDAVCKSSGLFNWSKFYLDARYDSRSVMRLFYVDVDKRTPHLPSALDRIGRETKVMLLDPAATNSMQRRMALNNDDIWVAMNSCGNVAAFKTIPGLARLDPTATGAIAADWTDIRWWSDALQSVTPKLTAVLKAAEHSKSVNPLADSDFMAARKSLENALAKLTSKTQSAFGDGWGLAVMYRLAKDPSVEVEMDIGWNNQFEHYHSNANIALGKTSGT